MVHSQVRIELTGHAPERAIWRGEHLAHLSARLDDDAGKVSCWGFKNIAQPPPGSADDEAETGLGIGGRERARRRLGRLRLGSDGAADGGRTQRRRHPLSHGAHHHDLKLAAPAAERLDDRLRDVVEHADLAVFAVALAFLPSLEIIV